MHDLRIKYEDEQLRRLAVDADHRHPRYDAQLTRGYRKVIGLIMSARDERDLRSMKALRLEKLRGDRAGQSSLRIYKGFRLIVRFRPSEHGRVTAVIELVDYHR